MTKYFLLLCMFSWLYACTGSTTTGITLMPEMREMDSAELLYFKTPDSQRYYTYLPVIDKSFIHSLVNDIGTGTVPEKPENTCMKEGKIYCHRNGAIINTVFFSYSTDGCRFLRFIKNGKLYYFNMSDELRKQLEQFKSQAKEVIAEH